MGRLHEVLAVEGGLKATADKIIKEAADTFTKKRGHFLGQHRSYEIIEEGSLQYADESKKLETTVNQKLDYVKNHFTKALDATFQKEVTNTGAKADIIVDGTTIAKDIPATYLLHLETKFKELRMMYDVIPTLDPGKDWKRDDTQENVYVSSDTEQYKTEKVVKPLLLHPATKEFPAQVDKISMDKYVGKWKTKNWSGALSPLQKSQLIGKIDRLVRAIKQARMRANNAEVAQLEIGKTLIDFIQ